MDRYVRSTNTRRDVRPDHTEELPLPADRLEQLRLWIASGGPDRPEVIEAIARRLLDNGEV
jgi:hypothetical protein